MRLLFVTEYATPRVIALEDRVDGQFHRTRFNLDSLMLRLRNGHNLWQYLTFI